MILDKCLRIANCSGFYGDRISAAREMVEGGAIDVLTGDWLAELTMLILARSRDRGGKAYAATFVTQMEQTLAMCLQKKIKVVSNAGGLDPQSCAAALREVAAGAGLSVNIAYITGDDLLPRMAQPDLDLRAFDTGEPIHADAKYLTANAYLGGWGIARALQEGADVVITGRVTDAALVMGPAAWFHRWRTDDWDALAGAVVAGHVIECGTQATGGNYSFFREIPGMERPGFPWADIAADGSAVIGKHEGTGGRVNVGTVVSQLLYEISDPRYLGPDVIARFDTLQVVEVAPDRVRISGARGEPPPSTLKVALNEVGGFRNELSIALTGLDIEEKAALVERAFWGANRYKPSDYLSATSVLIRSDKQDPSSNEEAVAIWRLTLKDPDERKVGRAPFNAVSELALASIPGFFRVGSQNSKDAREYGVYRPALIKRSQVTQVVHMNDGATITIEDVEAGGDIKIPISPTLADGESILQKDYQGGNIATPLGRLVGARSGDKGGNANIGVFVRAHRAWPWLRDFLTIEKLKELLPETRQLLIDRYELPNLLALNFVIHGLLQEGVAASTRQDGQAKSLGEWLRARICDLPRQLLETE